ncbi:MAG: hypothetical protein WC213_04205 [Arenimonas sp.]|jgi:hypothetical protein
MRQKIAWMKRIVRWAFTLRLFWLALIVVGLAAYICLEAAPSEQNIRLTGLALEMLGLAAAAQGIRDTRQLFGRPSFVQMIRSWLQSFPPLRSKTSMAAGSGTVSVSAVATGDVWIGGGSTIESRLDAAEKNLRSVSNRLNAAHAELDLALRRLQEKVAQEGAQREHEDRKLHEKIEMASADGLSLAAIGVVLLAAGLIFSTLPLELLNLVT